MLTKREASILSFGIALGANVREMHGDERFCMAFMAAVTSRYGVEPLDDMAITEELIHDPTLNEIKKHFKDSKNLAEIAKQFGKPS